jgi:DNA repair protein RadD
MTGLGVSNRVIIGTTPSEERAQSIEAFKRQEIKALVSVSVLTTGFDAPCSDALICLRPTCSPGLWVQMCGRLTRLYPGKQNGLVLDFTDNTKTHGPIDLIEVDGDGEVKTPEMKVCSFCGGLIPPKEIKCPDCGRTPLKACKKCDALNELDAEYCAECDEPFGQARKPRHNLEASTAQIISDGMPQVKTRNDWDFKLHKKEGKPDSVRVRYYAGLEYFDEWLCFDHGGYAASMAIGWCHRHGVNPSPTESSTASRTLHALAKMPKQITVRREGTYWRVLS